MLFSRVNIDPAVVKFSKSGIWTAIALGGNYEGYGAYYLKKLIYFGLT